MPTYTHTATPLRLQELIARHQAADAALVALNEQNFISDDDQQRHADLSEACVHLAHEIAVYPITTPDQQDAFVRFCGGIIADGTLPTADYSPLFDRLAELVATE